MNSIKTSRTFKAVKEYKLSYNFKIFQEIQKRLFQKFIKKKENIKYYVTLDYPYKKKEINLILAEYILQKLVYHSIVYARSTGILEMSNRIREYL